jgi:hypothetical protein
MATLGDTLKGIDTLLAYHKQADRQGSDSYAYAVGRVTTALALLLDEQGRESFAHLVRESGALDAQAERDAQAESEWNEWAVEL